MSQNARLMKKRPAERCLFNRSTHSLPIGVIFQVKPTRLRNRYDDDPENHSAYLLSSPPLLRNNKEVAHPWKAGDDRVPNDAMSNTQRKSIHELILKTQFDLNGPEMSF